MTTPPEVEQLAIVSGPTGQPWVTISNIRPVPSTNVFTVTFDTDVACLIQMDYWSHNDPSIPPGIAGAVTEPGATTRHTFTIPALPAGNHTGYYYGFSLRLDSNDVSGYQMRSQQGVVRLTGARSSRGLQGPVRWNMFGDGTRPANGGGTTTLGQGPAAGNWSSYTWAQYNPKQTTFPTP
jgi:hypothetical protein